MENTLNVFTLNCWGIPIVSKNRRERMEAIYKYLVASHHNIVCLQEVWSEDDYLYFEEKLAEVLPFSHYFYSGVLGSGLCVFSKWVIQDVFFHQWPLNGYIHKVHHGDWFGGKGVGLCRIKVSDLLVNVYCTHLHAEYHNNDMYLPHRVLQAYSTGEFVKLTSCPADISILAGDLNTAPGDLEFRLISQIANLKDPYDFNSLGSNPTIAKPSGTCDNINNSYTNTKLCNGFTEGKRIDHILFTVDSDIQVDILNFGNPLQDRVPGKDFSYSDHNAVTLELKLKQVQEKRLQLKRDSSRCTVYNETISEAEKICEEALHSIKTSRKMFLIIGSVLFLFLVGTVGFWQNSVLYDMFKILLTVACLYNLVMGVLWSKIEMNSLKAGITGLKNIRKMGSEMAN